MVIRQLSMAGFLILVMALSLPSLSRAGSFNINPVRIQLSETATTAILHVSNTGSEDVTVQLQAMKWSQLAGEDQLKTTRDLIATPQIFQLKARASQIVRIGLVKKPDLTAETTYRLILEEIPPPPDPGFQGLKLALRISMPVFVKPGHISESSFDIRLAPQKSTAADTINLELDNAGSTHVQLLNLRIHSVNKQDEVIGVLDKSLYLLAGQKKQIPIKMKTGVAPLGELLIKAETSAGKVEFHATSGAP